MAGEKETTSGGGFQVTVTRGAFPNRGEAKVAAYTKSVANIEMAIDKANQALEGTKAGIKLLKADLTEAKKGLKYWQGEAEAAKEE